ncbi:hypothetical protein SAMN06265222_101423 [Neorhodopirellula lusitana]|uniref:Uncharacterized protein n=1 Tax=Neorhodopirellula lusitana TaxID=445327 RepID=A0ABY1PP60_9BACT|nr:hypothetical protein [Neorhodopirellula lusitana]SMP40309.1 hypothetical protein SAMN06265222_101423 [Neorhodopirellula lusitana]
MFNQKQPGHSAADEILATRKTVGTSRTASGIAARRIVTMDGSQSHTDFGSGKAPNVIPVNSDGLNADDS